MIVFCFDRDKTVNVNQGPVPLGWVKKLKRRGYIVYATGNQRLKKEAGIPGTKELVKLTNANVDIQETLSHAGLPARNERVRMAKRAHPEAERVIVVDDVNLTHLEEEGIEYYHPEKFVKLFRGWFAPRWRIPLL